MSLGDSMAEEKDTDKKGYCSVTLKEQLERVDDHTREIGMDNRSGLIRMIVKKYYDLKEKGVDILKIDTEEIVKELKK